LDIEIMAGLWLVGAVVVYTLFAKGHGKLARLVLGATVIGTGLALIGAGLMGGRAQRDFQDILMLWLAPAILGMAVGFVAGRTRFK